MGQTKKSPDPNMRVAVVASISSQEAALLAGRLEAEGIRAMTAPSQAACGPWTAAFGLGPVGPVGVAANPLQRGTTDVLVDERDIKDARQIAARYLKSEVDDS